MEKSARSIRPINQVAEQGCKQARKVDISVTRKRFELRILCKFWWQYSVTPVILRKCIKAVRGKRWISIGTIFVNSICNKEIYNIWAIIYIIGLNHLETACYPGFKIFLRRFRHTPGVAFWNIIDSSVQILICLSFVDISFDTPETPLLTQSRQMTKESRQPKSVHTVVIVTISTKKDGVCHN
jgi:hypothetical protein